MLFQYWTRVDNFLDEQKIGYPLLLHCLLKGHGMYVCSNLTCVRTNNAAAATWGFFTVACRNLDCYLDHETAPVPNELVASFITVFM